MTNVETTPSPPIRRARLPRVQKHGLLRRAAEFTMIVIGVLVALAANAWWEGRRDAQLAGDYRERLAAELKANLATSDQIILHTTRVQAATDSLQSFFEDGTISLPAGRILVHLYNATRRSTLSFTSSTFDDLTNTGNLRLIKDPALRSALATVYGGLRRYTQDWYGSEYRTAARKAIPIGFQFQVRDECGAIAGPTWSGCEVAVDMRSAEAAANRIRTDSDLRGAYRIQAHQLAIFALEMASTREAILSVLSHLGT